MSFPVLDFQAMCIAPNGEVLFEDDVGKTVFWQGFGCTVRTRGFVAAFVEELAVKYNTHILIPKVDGIRMNQLPLIDAFFRRQKIERWFVAALTSIESDYSIQLPQDDAFFEKGESILLEKRYCNDGQSIGFNKEYKDKIDDVFWAGGFSGEGWRQKAVSEFRNRGFNNVNMVNRWNYNNVSAIGITPVQTWDDYQKILIIDGNSVAGNGIINACLGAALLYYGSEKPIWMQCAENYRHYYHVKDDFSNFNEILKILKDEQRCLQSVRALKEHISVFLRKEAQEDMLEQQVKTKLISRSLL